MAKKELALITEKKKRKKESVTTPTQKPTKETITNNKGTTKINRSTISTKPSASNTAQNRVVTNKQRLTSNSTSNDIRTVKSRNFKPKSIKTVDVYERGGRYYYQDGKKEKEVDQKFIQNAIKNKKTGVIGRYDSKGTLRTTDSKGNVKKQSGLDVASYLGRTAKTRAKKGTISIADAALQETQNDLKKGENLKSTGDKIAKFVQSILNANPQIGMRNAIAEATAKSKAIIKDKDKNALQKYVGSLLEGAEAIGTGYTKGGKDFTEVVGSLDKNLDEKVAKAQEVIDKPVNKEIEKLENEKYKYGKGVRTAADIVGVTANMAPVVAASVVTRNPDIALLTAATSAKGQATERALQRGADLDTATKIGTLSGLVEAGTERLTGGLKIFGKGSIDDILGNAVNSKIRNKGANFIAKQGLGILGEEGEEILSDLAGIMIDRGTIDPNAKYTKEDFLDTIKNTFGSTVLLNILTRGYGVGAYNRNVEDMQNYQRQQANEIAQRVESGEIDGKEGQELLKQVENGTYQQNKNLEEIATQEVESLRQAEQQGLITEEEYVEGVQTITKTVKVERERINNIKIAEPDTFAKKQGPVAKTIDKALYKAQGSPEGEYVSFGKTKDIPEYVQDQVEMKNDYTNKLLKDQALKNNEILPTNTDNKVENFRNSVINEKIDDADGFYKAVEKIIKDKDYNVIMDSSITNEKGQSVNAVISNENGITIRINPKSERAGEILLMHEVTHGIETKEMSDLIMNYASKDSEFNNQLENLKKAYGTENITPEVIADISGQMFGKQEFINMLSTENPSLFKKIYDAIMSLANKLTGNSNYDLFYKDLKSKWEKAYRKSNTKSAQQNLKEGAKYSQNAEITDITDNDGNKLSKGQVSFFDESYARENEELDGKLVKVYHTMTNEGLPFFEFNPVGTEGYREEFGNQTVNFFTDNPAMSGSYADHNYLKANTKKTTNVSEIQDFLDKLNEKIKNEKYSKWEVRKITKDDHFKNAEYVIESDGLVIPFESQNDLFRNWNNKLADTLNKTNEIAGKKHNIAKWQYSGYLNLKNPYIVDCEGRMYHQALLQVTEEKNNIIDKVEKYKNKLNKLANESYDKHKAYLSNNGLNNYMYHSTMDKLKNEILYNIPDDKLSSVVNNYEEVYKDANKNGLDLPNPNDTLEDIFASEDYGIIEDLKETYDEYFVDSTLSMTLKDFLEDYNNLSNAKENYGTEYSWFAKNFKNEIDEDINLESITPEEWYKISKEMFSQKARNSYAGEEYNTNDVIAHIIKRNKDLAKKYDGLIFKNIRDWAVTDIIEAVNAEPANVYVTFNSNQFKAEDNLNPTNDPDMRYSKQEDKWQKYLEKKFPNTGTKTILKDKIKKNKVIAKTSNGQNVTLKKNSDNTYTKEIKQPKNNKTIIPKEALESQVVKLKDETKLSNFYSNIVDKSKFITEDNAEKLSQEDIWNYAPQTNKETMQKALDDIGDTQLSLEKSYNKFLNKEVLEAEDIAKGWIFLKRFQDAKNYDAMVQVVKKMRNSGATKAGRTVQMFNLQSRLTPEGMLYYAQSELSEAEQKYNEGKSLKQIEKHAKDFTLTEQETKYIKDQMEKIQNMEDGREKDVEMAKINKMLSDKLPNEKGDWLRAWMRIAMLGNFKTQVRNIGGNAMITPVNALADVPSAIADKAISKFTGVRTIGAPTLRTAKAYAKGFAKGGKEAYQDYKMDIDTKDVDISRFDITQKNPFNTKHKGAAKVLNPLSKVGNKTNKLLDLAMSGGDRVFYQGAYEASLRNQMVLNNVDTPTQDMIDIARQEALARTWNDNNDYTNFVLNTRRALNKFSKNGLGSGYGLGDVLIPFAKTPANLTKAIVDYSPVGLASSIFKTKQIKRAIETGQITAQIQHDFAQNLGKGVAGTMLYGLALALAKAGIASGSGDDDKDVANFIKNTMGIQPYSITINGKSFTYDWAQPIAAPLAIITDATKDLSAKTEEGVYQKVMNTVMDVANTGFNVLMQQSFLSGMAEVLNNQEGIVNGVMEQVLSLPARAVPTLFKQINDMFDTTQRSAYEKNKPLTTAKQNAMAKTPASKKLAPQVDTLGREIQKYGGNKNKVTYALKSFLSPANKSNARTTKVADEIYRLYESTGDKTIMPKVAPYYVQNKTIGRVDLSSHDRAEYQKTSGKIVTSALTDLINDSKYQKLNDDKKAQVVNKVVNYADAKAKQKFTKQISSYYAPADRKITGGVAIADYYLGKVK